MKIKLKESQIHLTNKCNLRCIFCDVSNLETKDLSDEKWEEIVQDLCDLKPFNLTISGGGEPLFRPQLLMRIIKLVKEKGIKTSVITNGTLVSQKLAREIVESQCDEWRESIHTPFSKVDKFIRGKSYLLRSFRGIRWIAKWKEKLNTNLPKLVIFMTLTKFNIYHIPAMIKKANSLKVNSILLRMVNPPTNERVYPTIFQRENVVKNLGDYRKMANKYGIKLELAFSSKDILQRDGGDITCLIPFHELVIFADGRVSVCCNFIKDGINSPAIESLRNKSLKEIWFGEKFNDFRRKMLKGIKIKRCKECTPDFKTTEREYRRRLLNST